jgi:hypothetical protein
MKHLLVASLLLASLTLSAQEEEVVFDHVTVHGGFGGPIIELTNINGKTGVMGGGGGGVIVNDFFFGGFGQGGGFGEQMIDGRLYPIDLGYGGLWMGYVKPTYKAFHFYSSLKIAGGEVNLTDPFNNGVTVYDETVFVVQPEAGIELNLISWFRIALTANYRIVSGIDSQSLWNLSNSDFTAGGMALTLRFGKFYRD